MASLGVALENKDWFNIEGFRTSSEILYLAVKFLVVNYLVVNFLLQSLTKTKSWIRQFLGSGGHCFQRPGVNFWSAMCWNARATPLASPYWLLWRCCHCLLPPRWQVSQGNRDFIFASPGLIYEIQVKKSKATGRWEPKEFKPKRGWQVTLHFYVWRYHLNLSFWLSPLILSKYHFPVSPGMKTILLNSSICFRYSLSIT